MLDKAGIIRELKANFCFTRELSPQQLEALAEDTICEEYIAGKVLIDKIADCPGIALILSGGLRVSKISHDGREVTLYRVSKGSTCPLSSVCILGGIYIFPAKVIAEVDTKILWVSKDFVSRAMVNCEPFWRFVFSCMASRLCETMGVVDNIAFVPIKKRLAQILLTKSTYGKHPIYTTHDALARELGTAREVISRELKSMERAGILKLSRGRLSVENTAGLAEVAGNKA